MTRLYQSLYRKRPVVVEARRINAQDWDEVEAIAQWAGAQVVDIEAFLAHGDPAVMAIRTPEGVMYADDGDFVIKGIAGEFYPCKSDVFYATYEPVVNL